MTLKQLNVEVPGNVTVEGEAILKVADADVLISPEFQGHKLTIQEDATLETERTSIMLEGEGMLEVNGKAQGHGSSGLTLSANATYKLGPRATSDGFAIETGGDSRVENSGDLAVPLDSDGMAELGGALFQQIDRAPDDGVTPTTSFTDNGERAIIEGDFNIERTHGGQEGVLLSGVAYGGTSDGYDLYFGDPTDAFLTAFLKLGRSPGKLTVTSGMVGLSPALTTEIEIAGTTPGQEHDWMQVTGALELGGNLELKLLDGFEQDVLPDDTFAVFTADAVTGEFLNVAPGARLATADGLGSFQVNYGPDSDFDPDHVVLSDFGLGDGGDSGDAIRLQLGEVVAGGAPGEIEFNLIIEGPSNATMVIETSTDLETWTELEAVVLGEDGMAEHSVTADTAISDRRFYRVRLEG